MIDSQQVLQAIASSGSKSSMNSQEIAQKLGVKLLDVEMLLHRMQDDGDVELELIRFAGWICLCCQDDKARANPS